MSNIIKVNKNPDHIILEMLRVAREGIVTFPNMGFWRNRFQLGFLGRMPVSNALPNDWYNTPNIHLCTFSDFENLCKSLEITIIEKKVLNAKYSSNFLAKLLPNFFGEIALYKFKKE